MDAWVPVVSLCDEDWDGDMDITLAVCIDPEVAFRTMVIIPHEVAVSYFGLRLTLGEALQALRGSTVRDILLSQGYSRTQVDRATADRCTTTLEW
jgi:hypothetical protein